MTSEAPTVARLRTLALRQAPGAKTWKWIGALQFTVIAAIAIALAVALDPQPHSDWLYYWLAAGDLTLYQRGGGGLALLAFLKIFGALPVVASLVINLASAAALLSAAYRVDHTAWKWYAQLVAGVLFVVTPYYGIVQLDMLAAALLVVAVDFVASQARSRRGPVLALAILLSGLAVSTKPQLALVIWAMAILLTPIRWWVRKSWSGTADALFIVMLVGSLLGFAADYGTRAVAGQRDSMRTTSAVTLYSGLLVSGEGRACGYWSVEAAEAAKADMGQPLLSAVAKRLAEQPPMHWMGVVACKTPQIILPPPFGLHWLVESPSVRTMLDASPDRVELERWYARALRLERATYHLLELTILLTVLVTTYRYRKPADGHAAIAATWILAFWGVHAVFEIQGRYFLPMFLLAPILASLAAHGGAGSRSRTWKPGLTSPSGKMTSVKESS